MQYSLTYPGFQEDLEGLHLLYGAAEAHGILCGMLSANSRDSEDRWIRELFDHSKQPAMEQPDAVFATLARETRIALIDKNDLFDPLLPDDDQPLKERAEALRDWSAGFLYGLGLNRHADDNTLSSEASEGLRDLADIANMDMDSVEDGEDEDDETHLAEIIEYIRVVAALLVDELAIPNAARERHG